MSPLTPPPLPGGRPPPVLPALAPPPPAQPGRYSDDVLATDWRQPRRGRSVPTAAEPGLVVEDATTGFCGAVVAVDKHGVTLEDRHNRRRTFALGAGFLLEGAPVELTRPVTGGPPKAATRTASGSTAVHNSPARVARGSRLLVEGKHDAELVERVWGDDLRIEGVVVELLDGADNLMEVVRDFAPGPQSRLGVLLDHLVTGSKETRIAAEVSHVFPAHVLIVGHPYVDIWQAVRPSVMGLKVWPTIPRGTEWKSGIAAALGWPHADAADLARAWRQILGRVNSYADLEPALLGRVEELIDFVTVHP